MKIFTLNPEWSSYSAAVNSSQLKQFYVNVSHTVFIVYRYKCGKAKHLSNRPDQSQFKLIENSLTLQVKVVKEFIHPFNQDVRVESPSSHHSLDCKKDYKLNILDLHPNCFWQMQEFIYKNWINLPQRSTKSKPLTVSHRLKCTI